MSKQISKLLTEVESLIQLGKDLMNYGYINPGDTEEEKISEFTFWRIKIGELLAKLYAKDSNYLNAYNGFMRGMRADQLHMGSAINLAEPLGILSAVKHDLENGLLDDLTKLLQADIFSDFIDMSEHLLKGGYKDAAAVIIGSVLEDTIRKLAVASLIPITHNNGKRLTIEPLNVELEKKGVYNALIKKQITSWVDLRNNAAHGHYNEYDSQQVKAMIDYVTNFTSTYLV
jgi:hypothetical protein